MPSYTPPQDIELIQIDLAHLRQIAAGEHVDLGTTTALEGALPPGHVATLALAEIDAGTPQKWCVPFLIVSKSRNAILGSCRFKTVPIDGEVEISYGIARELWGQGIATVAIGQLVAFAAAEASVTRVVANILPDNDASSSLARRLGFARERVFTDLHGDEVVRWVWNTHAGVRPAGPP
jgi:ribosomal-protein-alanine N-acetyltransferase